MATKPASVASLIFSWRKPPTTLAVLGSFLVLSTLIHAMGFYVFHVVYQPAVSLPPSPSHLTIIDPASPASEPFLAWLNSEDPALTFSPDPVSPDLAALSPAYQTSVSLFDVEHFSPVGPAPSNTDETTLARLIPEPVIFPARRPIAADTEETKPPRSAFADVRFDLLQPMAKVVIPVQETNAAPAEFMLGIDRRGTVVYLFAERSSDNDAVDKELSNRLREIAFPADDSRPEIAWETARISWRLKPEEAK